MTLEERIAAIERHLFGRAYTDPSEPAAEAAPDVPAADVPAEEAPAADVPAEPVPEGGPASV